MLYTRQQAENATKTEEWGSLTWLAGEAVGNAQGLTLGRVVIKRGECNPRHAHNACEEILHLVRGRVEHTLGDKTFTMEPGDTFTVPVGVFHNAISIGDEDAEMIVAFSSARRDFVPEDKP